MPSSESKIADPRTKNILFSSESVSAHFSEYRENLNKALDSLDTSALDASLALMKAVAKRGGTFFVAGNGGSAAISDHLCCDWSKGTFTENLIRLRTQSLASNTALLTAMANDFGQDQMFASQLKIFGQTGDALLAISSSGNSPNIIKLVEQSKSMGLPVIGLSGFTGGGLKAMADISLHIDFSNYGIVEDAHQIIMHNLAQFFYTSSKPKLS